MSSDARDSLFAAGHLGALALKNRIIMPALTRGRCAADGTVTKDVCEYYTARADAGMIITEPCAVSPSAKGMRNAPNLFAPEHVAGMKTLTDALHAKGCTVVCQLWHTGRMSHTSFLPSGEQIVAASAIRVGEEGEQGVKACGVQALDGTWHSHELPRALTTTEVEEVVESFGRAAALAVAAGFDGVEIHAGGGYLIDTFLQSTTNTRADKYGGSMHKRAQLLLEIVGRVCRELPASRVGVRLTPNSGFNGMGAPDNAETFLHAAQELSARHHVAYLHVQEGLGTSGAMPSFYGKISSDGFHKRGQPLTLHELRQVVTCGLVGNGEYTADRAAAAICAGHADAVSFGRGFMGNADLVSKFRADKPLDSPPAEECWFGASSRAGVAPSWGYTDLTPATKRTRVLHLLGSPASDYYEQLSTMYARGCVASCEPSCASEFEFVYAVVHADGPAWSFPASLEPKAIADAPRCPIPEGIATLAALKADVAQSHMFCVQGVSTFRAILDMLHVPFVGGTVDAMTLTTHKQRTKAVVEAAGVPCPASQVLRKGEEPHVTIAYPFIVKPCSEDNSMGVAIVKSAEELDEALDAAFAFDDEVMLEAFVPPGREIRFAVLEDEWGEPTISLPGVEYFMSKEKPIRTSNDKLVPDKSGKLSFAKPARACPADIDDVLLAKLADASRRAHVALGATDYSLFDFRIDPEGNPYFLEASLFCCFAANSVISMMGDATGTAELGHQNLFKTMLRRAVARKPEAREAGQVVALGSGAQRKKKMRVKKIDLTESVPAI